MTEYQPKHLRLAPPSLDYEAWIMDLKADEDADLFPEQDEPLVRIKVDVSGFTMGLEQAKAQTQRFAESLQRFKDAFPGAFTEFPVPESRAGHEWTSRSWFT